jgi:hypothetical protein
MLNELIKKNITFPLRLNADLNEEIDTAVFFTKAKSKHEYVINAVKEKLQRDMEHLEDETLSK